MTAAAQYVLKDALADMRKAIEGLPDEALDWKPRGEDTNSIAVLVTHTLHSGRSWLSVATAAPLPDRDRDSEFKISGSTTADLLAFFDDFVAQCQQILQDAGEMDWSANRKAHMRPDPSLPDYVPAAFALLHMVEHTGEHVAHITLTRQLWEARA